MMDFAEIFRRMTAGETVPGSVPKTYKVYTVKRNGTITDAMDILRETNNQYIFIRGKSSIPNEKAIIEHLSTNRFPYAFFMLSNITSVANVILSAAA